MRIKHRLRQYTSNMISMTQVEMGLTWIDHDVIEVPVEEIEVGRQRQIINFF